MELFNADGSPIDPEVVVVLPKAEHTKLVEELAQKNQATANLVSEIKELREKKQLTETEKAALEAKIKDLSDLSKANPEELTPVKIDALINQRLDETLSKKDKESRIESRNSALKKFKELNKEFSESNDVGGLKMSAFERKLSMFNMDSPKSTEDFYTVFENARLLLKKEEGKTDTIQNPYSHTPSNETPTIKVDNLNDNLTAVEQKIIDRTFGGDKKRYLEQRLKRPDYVETLLKYAR